jgi:hypothetical protein
MIRGNAAGPTDGWRARGKGSRSHELVTQMAWLLCLTLGFVWTARADGRALVPLCAAPFAARCW